MNTINFFRQASFALIAIASCAAATTGVEAQTIDAATLLNANRCDHVIRLLYQHGVNNSVDRSAEHAMLYRSPFGNAVIPATEMGDLEIVQVSQVRHDDPACGPTIAVDIRNNSVRDVSNFHVTAVAVFGRIRPMSPSVTVTAGKVCAGQALQVELTLPLDALAMGKRQGQVIGFQTLVVAIDSFDQLMETNEANNLRAIEASRLPVLEPAVVNVELPTPASLGSASLAAEATVGQVGPRSSPAAEMAPSATTEPPPAPTTDLQDAIQELGKEDVSIASTGS